MPVLIVHGRAAGPQRQRRHPGHPPAAPAHRNRRTPRWGGSPAAEGSGRRPLPDPVTGERRHRPLSTHQPHSHHGIGRPRHLPRHRPADRHTAALPRRSTIDRPPLRQPLGTPGPPPARDPPALGPPARRHHPLAAPHHPHLARTTLRLRHRPRLRRPHRHPSNTLDLGATTRRCGTVDRTRNPSTRTARTAWADAGAALALAESRTVAGEVVIVP